MIMTKEMGAMLKMLLCACLWSIAGIIIKLVDMNPFAIAGLRSFFAAATVAVFMRLTSKRVIVNKKTLLERFFFAQHLSPLFRQISLPQRQMRLFCSLPHPYLL